MSIEGMSGKLELRKSGKLWIIRLIPSPIAVIRVQLAANNWMPPGVE